MVHVLIFLIPHIYVPLVRVVLRASSLFVGVGTQTTPWNFLANVLCECPLAPSMAALSGKCEGPGSVEVAPNYGPSTIEDVITNFQN